ncbi:MAG: hypothetical protein WA865_09030 [Spirulinaceae cyanobacterium]
MGAMLDISSLFEFSRSNCIAICAFLVPANLLATSQTLLFLLQRRSSLHLYLIVTLAVSLAIIMVCHVATWFVIGVVQVQTFVLFGLGSTCLVANLAAITYRYTQNNQLSKQLES